MISFFEIIFGLPGKGVFYFIHLTLRVAFRWIGQVLQVMRICPARHSITPVTLRHKAEKPHVTVIPSPCTDEITETDELPVRSELSNTTIIDLLQKYVPMCS